MIQSFLQKFKGNLSKACHHFHLNDQDTEWKFPFISCLFYFDGFPDRDQTYYFKTDKAGKYAIIQVSGNPVSS